MFQADLRAQRVPAQEGEPDECLLCRRGSATYLLASHLAWACSRKHVSNGSDSGHQKSIGNSGDRGREKSLRESLWGPRKAGSQALMMMSFVLIMVAEHACTGASW